MTDSFGASVAFLQTRMEDLLIVTCKMVVSSMFTVFVSLGRAVHIPINCLKASFGGNNPLVEYNKSTIALGGTRLLAF